VTLFSMSGYTARGCPADAAFLAIAGRYYVRRCDGLDTGGEYLSSHEGSLRPRTNCATGVGRRFWASLKGSPSICSALTRAWCRRRRRRRGATRAACDRGSRRRRTTTAHKLPCKMGKENLLQGTRDQDQAFTEKTGSASGSVCMGFSASPRSSMGMYSARMPRTWSRIWRCVRFQ
jgi:hypothetical protein